MPFPLFDRSRLKLRPLSERRHDMVLEEVLEPDGSTPAFEHPDLSIVADRVVDARRNGRPVILMMGAHVIKVGLSRLVIDLMERGLVTHVAGNGACAIHDYELALIGATTESVADYIRSGEFGLWEETGEINTIAASAVRRGIGLGEAVGSAVLDGDLAHTDVSIYAAAARLGIPATVHVGIGSDIIHEHPNCDGAAVGAASYTDFLVFTQSVSDLEGGVLLNYGTAVMGPEVYLKALSMVRNVAVREGRQIARFTTAVFDLIDLGDDLESEAPRSDPRYYYRPFKTILVRTVRDGGEGFYIRGDHTETLPALRSLLVDRTSSAG
ncbi:MAG: hypothetical protein QGI83_25325 [Candidatus Latescibacteria bacterium]|jgi:hypothetical protein|nr:hypothetical protein [Candidatus Latescibacterota bacterium]